MKTAASLLILVLLLAAGGPAAADDWGDARSAFRGMLRSERWQDRASAYQTMLDYDGAKAFKEVFSAAMREKNARVKIEAIRTIGQFESAEARAALLKALNQPKSEKGLLLLMALAGKSGDFAVPRLIEILRGKDAQPAALAANALGAKAVEAGFMPLVEALKHKEWQVAAAAARGLRAMAWSEKTKPDKRKGTEAQPKMPDWFEGEKVLIPLIDTLKEARGVLRGDLIETLEVITKKDYGDNHAAWVAHANGQEVTEGLLALRKYPPHFFGVPIYGRRVVVVYDTSVLTENVHPFTKRERLQELCRVPGGRDVPWFKIKSIQHFNYAWTRRFIQDMPTKRQFVEFIFSGKKPDPVFGRLQSVNPSTKTRIIEQMEKTPAQNDNDIMGTMILALDLSGKKDSAAWSKGPDEIVCVYSSVPWRADETDPEVVGATVGLKARRRQVKITAVGVHEHAYNMMKLFAEQSGGRYLSLTQ
ncbi:MAG: HEAT repeat domain-containing protein [Planctomycetota bacterium]|nr:HEAT repeat domain-containing protein [Planctomycetota bacterium]